MEEHEKHHKKSKTLSSTFYKKLMVMFSLVLIIFALYNIYQGKSFRVLFEEKLAEAKEAARPAELQLTIISTTCYDCYDINAVVDILELAGDNITSKKELVFLSEEANRLIKEYQIDKVPTIIVTGELNKSRALSTLNSAGKELKGMTSTENVWPNCRSDSSPRSTNYTWPGFRLSSSTRDGTPPAREALSNA